MLSKRNQSFGRQVRRALLVGLFFSVIPHAVAEVYKPLFSDEMLRTLDPATRERFAELESENRRRWRNRNPQTPDVAAVKQQHEETEAMLRRFEESRFLEQQADSRRTKRSSERNRKCRIVAAEIKELSSGGVFYDCLLYTSPSPRDRTRARMPSSA